MSENTPMSTYDVVMQSEGATVVAEYKPAGRRASAYQSEAELEAEFIRLLVEQGYEYLSFTSEAELIANLRTQIEKLNSSADEEFRFSDTEWQSFFSTELASPNDGVVEKTRKLQDDLTAINITRDNGSSKNIYLLDKKRIFRNHVQVINQYEVEGMRKNRYDVTVLVNGLPMVHIELKRRGIDIREAFRQIKRYERDSFWAGSGLFEFVQLFVVSNGTETKYYSNTTRDSHVREQQRSGARRGKKTSNSFEFTSYWADGLNKRIPDLVDFTKTFFSKHTLLGVLTRYCVFTAEELLLVMRPYQIAACERILNRIEVAANYKWEGSERGGGYIWHSTGSGKTLTSFKAAVLATKIPGVDKVLFVVDRKDLDWQTVKEYDKFEKGAANGNTSTQILARNLGDPGKPILVTTIQKLDRFISKHAGHEVFSGHTVLIFDECHRSQFGDMQKRIRGAFKRYNLFGFTGTPIFAANAPSGAKADFKTTEQVFGERLHTYTIVDAIRDQNILKFHVDYLDTMKMKEDVRDTKVRAIDDKAALEDPRRVAANVSYLLDRFDTKTKRNTHYKVRDKRLAGFNSLFATSSIPMAMKYYAELRKQIEERGCGLKVGLIYSYAPNEEDPDDMIVTGGAIPDESMDTAVMDQTQRDFLDGAIADYNKMFATNYDTSGDNFENYYQDVSNRMKNRDLDILVVVNMFLTGFDATTLNTLWVDKKLCQHGLIQAFSRTNRILNRTKNCGNIVCFRDLEKETDEAIALFGDRKAGGVVLIRPYLDYLNGYVDENGKHVAGYRELLQELSERFPNPADIALAGEDEKKAFVRLFGRILRARNVLNSFDEFADDDTLSPRDLQNYQGIYISLMNDMRPADDDPEVINDDLVFEVELVKQTEINVDYILKMIAEYRDAHAVDKDVRLDAINRAIDSSIELRSKKALIAGFIDRINASGTDIDWRAYVGEQKTADLAEIIATEGLIAEATESFVRNALRDGELPTTGTALDSILPPTSMFTPSGDYERKRQGVLDALRAYFEKYLGLG